MTSFKTFRQCFAKLETYDKRLGLPRLLGINGTLLLISVTAFQLFGANAWALPTVLSYGHFTDRVPPNPLPAYPGGADLVQVFAVIQSSDPVGSPTISTQAVQGGTTHSLDLIPPEGIDQDYNVFYKFIDLDRGLTGAWEIVPTDSTGIGPSTYTNPIAEPEFIPFVENITLQGTPLGARVSWTLPNLDGFDVDEVLGIDILEVTSGKPVFKIGPFALQTTSYQPPAGTLQVGVEYVYSILLADYEGSDLENLSRAFSEPFRYTIAGDFNTDGTVDAADYVVWRNGLGTTHTQNDYNVWRSHFGASLGSGSGSAGYPLGASVESLPAAVPEPASFVLMLVGVLTLANSRRGRTAASVLNVGKASRHRRTRFSVLH
jgi:hypothetical protein